MSVKPSGEIHSANTGGCAQGVSQAGLNTLYPMMSGNRINYNNRMGMKKMVFIFIFVFVLLNVGAQERSLTIWNKNEVAINPWEKITIEVAQKIHYSPESSTIDLKYGEMFIEHEPLKGLEYGAGFRVSRLNLQNNNWRNENRSMLFVNFSKPMDQFELNFTNRLEYRAFKELDNYFRHKQSLKLDFPNITEWGMRFYVSEESYYKMNGDGTHLARFYSGLKALEKERIEMKIYYSLERAKVADNWITADIIGLNLSFTI